MIKPSIIFIDEKEVLIITDTQSLQKQQKAFLFFAQKCFDEVSHTNHRNMSELL